MPNPKKNKNRKKEAYKLFMNNFWKHFFFFVPASASAAGALQRILFQHIFENKRITYKTENFNRLRGKDWGRDRGGGEDRRISISISTSIYSACAFDLSASRLAAREATINIFHFPVARVFVSLFVISLFLSLLCCLLCVCCLAGYLWILIQVHVAEMKSKFLNLDLHKPPPQPKQPPTTYHISTSI